MAGSQRSIGRWIVGWPRIWVGCGWCVIGLAWLALAVFNVPGEDRLVSRYVFGGFFLTTGIVYLVVAVRDRRLGLGRYQDPAAAFRHQQSDS